MLTLRDHKDIEAIDHAVGLADIVPAEIAFAQYQKFPQYICVVRNRGKVVGYTCMLALKPDVFYKYKSGKITEPEIKIDDIDFDTKPAHILWQAIAVHPKYQGRGIARELIEDFKNRLNEMQVAELIAECSTPAGVKIATKYFGMKPFGPSANGQIFVG